MLCKVGRYGGHEFDRRALGKVEHQPRHDKLLLAAAVEIAAQKIMGPGRLERNAFRPVHHRHGEIVIDRHIRPRGANMAAQFLCELDQPALANGLVTAPVRIEPIDRFRDVLARFHPAACAAMVAHAHGLPPNHVEEHGVDIVALCDFGRLRPDEVPVSGIVEAA